MRRNDWDTTLPAWAPYAGAAVAAVATIVAINLWMRRNPSSASVTGWRKTMLECARAHAAAKTPYQWGGGHHGDSWGLDCSGLIIDCAAKAGINLQGWGSQRMWAELPHTATPQPADLVFYSPRHVVMVESFDPKTGIARIIGSNGGDSSSTSPERAAQQGAFVRLEPTQLYRSGFQGFMTIVPLLPAGLALA